MRILGGGILSGLLLCLALPLGERAFLAWVALVPVLVATRGRGFLAGFLGGLTVVFTCAQLAISGLLYEAKAPGGGEAWVYTGCGLFGFSVAIALGVWGERGTEAKPAWWFAALATLLEAVLLFQLPAHLALTQYRSPVALSLASLGGIWLVSFLLWWANFAFADLWIRGQRSRLALALLPMGLFLVPMPQPTSSRRTIEAAAIQASLDDPDRLVDLHKTASQGGAELVVWPEFGGIPFVSGGDASALVRIAKTSSPIVTSFSAPGDQPLPYNVAALFSETGESERYAKRRPFGQETAMHAAGRKAQAVRFGRSQLGLNICFDSCYPHLIRETAALPYVTLIALPTIDPQSPHGFLAAMHAAFTPFRAAENGIPIVRADGHAYSLVVDCNGQILAEALPGEATVVEHLPLANRDTLAERVGEGWLAVCGALFLFGLRTKGKPKEHSAP